MKRVWVYEYLSGGGDFHGDELLRMGVSIDREASAGARLEQFERIARATVQAIPGLRGFVGIDVVWHEGRGPVVIEVNPRVTSACVGLSAAPGRNLAAEVLDA